MYVMPFIEQTKPIQEGIRVLEIGCGEGGVLAPFADRGCYCVGVDLACHRIEHAQKFFALQIAAGKMNFHCENIYDEPFVNRYAGSFDIIILKDVIEHIPQQEKFVLHLKTFLKSGGQIFFGFPPWYMPFGGHQQVCEHKLTSKLPYYHILPKGIYKRILKMNGEPDHIINELLEIWNTQITIERFEKIIRKSGLKILHKQPYLINPIYRYKFGLKPRKQIGFINAIPYVRDFLTTCVYYMVG
ncbi:MAG: methyltransferase domain-containing protein [Taibaiella sp.]|nr:methyltransferase domain-containing protein [Taibaiella sp.]